MPNGRKNEVQNVLQSILGRVFHHLFAVAFANLPLQHVKAMKVHDLLPTSEAYPCPLASAGDVLISAMLLMI